MTDLPIPAVALDDAGIVLGRRGAGKSNVLMVLFEHELDAGRRSIMVDPKGDRWGVRLNPDRSPSRFTIPILGGKHGDVPLAPENGAALGRALAGGDLSCLIDLSLMTLAAKQAFMLGFAPALLDANAAPLTLFIEEVDQFANQDPRYQPPLLVHHIANFATLGRQRGIVPWVASQRPAKVNATVRSQADTFVAMRVMSPLDRAAFAEWFRGHSKEAAARVEDEVGKLAKGEALVFVGEDGFFERVQFPLASTFDSGRTPRHGERIEGVELPRLELGDLAAALAPPPAAPPGAGTRGKAAERKAYDVAIDLAVDRNLDAVGLAKDLIARDARIAESDATIARLEEENMRLRALVIEYEGRSDQAVSAFDAIAEALDTARGLEAASDVRLVRLRQQGGQDVDGERVGGAAAAVHRTDRAAGRGQEGGQRRHQGRLRRGEGDGVRYEDDAVDHPPAGDGEGGAAGAGGAARDIQVGAGAGGLSRVPATPGLNSAAEKVVALMRRVSPAVLSIAQAAQLTGYKTSGGHFRAALNQLRASDAVVFLGGEKLAAQWVGTRPHGMDRDAALALWRDVLPGAAPKMIDELLRGAPARTLSDLAIKLGLQTTGGHFRAGIKALREAGVVVDVEAGGVGAIRLADPLPGEDA